MLLETFERDGDRREKSEKCNRLGYVIKRETEIMRD